MKFVGMEEELDKNTVMTDQMMKTDVQLDVEVSTLCSIVRLTRLHQQDPHAGHYVEMEEW